MPKTKISEFSATPANNTDIDSINIAENCAPSGINDAIRELMAQLKDWQSGTSNDPYVVGSSGSLTLNQGTANTVPYLNGSKVVTSGTALSFDGTNLGIGTSSPTARVHVSAPDGTAPLTLNTAGGADTTRALNFNVAGDNYGKILVPSASGGAMAFWTGGANAAAERMRLDASGNLGIGTTSPATKLEAAGTIRASRSGSSGTYIELFGGSGAADPYINVPSGFGIPFLVGGTERARITSAGDFLVGKTSAGSAAGLILWGQTNTAGYGRIDFSKTSSGTFIASEYSNNGTPVGTITYSNTATAYNTASDYRLKNTIAPMTGALAKVAQLKPCTYTWKADGSTAQGFIAHELAEVCPHAVTGEKDAVETYTDAEGNEQTRPKYQGIDTSFLVATLTAAIQEQQAIIESLKARLDAANL